MAEDHVTIRECEIKTSNFESTLERIEGSIHNAVKEMKDMNENHRLTERDLYRKINGVPNDVKWLTWGFRLIAGAVVTGYVGAIFYILRYQ